MERLSATAKISKTYLSSQVAQLWEGPWPKKSNRASALACIVPILNSHGRNLV
jgi:hypothetical protein